MDKYITDILQVYLSIFFLIMLSNELISGTVLKSWYCDIRPWHECFL